jgi:hypothetical protein
MKKTAIVFLLMLLVPFSAHALSKKQQKVLSYVYETSEIMAVKHDVAGIIMQESQAGKLGRRGDGGAAYGVGQMHLDTALHVMEYYYGKHHGWTEAKLKHRLMTDDRFAIKMSIRYYKMLLSQFKDRKKAILAYNIGPGNMIKHGFSFDPNDYLNLVLGYSNHFKKNGIV